MKYGKYEIESDGPATWKVLKRDKMRVPARFFALESMLSQIYRDNAIKQIINVATLPGIYKYALAMPDIHYGYGFPIGGVAAFSTKDGIISPGGVGYDINCGVRLCKTNLKYDEIKGKIKDIITGFYNSVPSGVGSHSAIKKLNVAELNKVLENGSEWAVSNGFGDAADLQTTESYGIMQEANQHKLSSRAKERGLNQLGTLGSGNHFVEIGVVDEVYNKKTASEFELDENQVILIIHTGSRGLGYQVCDDYLHRMVKEQNKYDFELADKQLSCAPLNSNIGSDYYQSMAAAANYAWANRQVIMSLVSSSLEKTLSISPNKLGFELIYDVCHNIAKIERHNIDGEEIELCVHRKGATRSFGPQREELPQNYRRIGQPVIIPGDMGTNSYLMLGTKKAMKQSFGSCCHGAGRVMSRTAARRRFNFNEVKNKLQNQGIVTYSAKKNTLVEESPDTYKDINLVVEAVDKAGLAKKVIRTRPLGVLKG